MKNEKQRVAKRLHYKTSDQIEHKKKKPKWNCASDSEYGPEAAEVDVSDSELREKIQVQVSDEAKCLELERATVGQHNPSWSDALQHRLTTSRFGVVCNMRETTSCQLS
ncbi:hypothetical protein PR048_020955 [Dryococelus australis]|uniref:Uncharacterized protein n=1 Tax=Dryococelus australis TaxID=614101 RepID=A0ABQ9GWV1_9NEOP|nr:hypothetical protein PR048_020955 [Dryococelus australis]